VVLANVSTKVAGSSDDAASSEVELTLVEQGETRSQGWTGQPCQLTC
jgi:hypothetical protein